MRNKYIKFTNIFFVFLLLTIVFFIGCENKTIEKHSIVNFSKEKPDSIVKIEGQNKNEIAITPPPFSDGIFPCSQCHAEMETNPERRVLGMHDEIDASFSHDKENRWCLDCHYAKNRDFLKLASGKLLDFKESYKLCGQCHGDKYRDWKVGVHGKRTGYWNGQKLYYLCVNCHNPHSPKFKAIKPLPAPARQEDIY